MDNVLRVKILNGTKYMVNDQCCFIFRNSPIFLKKVVRHGDAIHQLHDNVDVLIVVHTLIKLYDVWMIHLEHYLDF